MFLNNSGYGWAGYRPATTAKNLIMATERFEEIRKLVDFDSIAFTGSSGCAIAFPLLIKNKNLGMLYIRKAGESSHGSAIEYTAKNPVEKYIIVDDFVDSGATVRRIVRKINTFSANHGVQAPECVGVFIWLPQFKVRDDCKIRNLPVYT